MIETAEAQEIISTLERELAAAKHQRDRFGMQLITLRSAVRSHQANNSEVRITDQLLYERLQVPLA